jgi:hypothetical protein
VTLYKFGFPETILFLYSGLYDKKMKRGMRLKDLLDGVGTVIHHSSSALYIAMIVIKIYPPTRTSIEVVVPVLVQHWFVLLNYGFSTLYVVVETILEVWFEWTVISSLEALHNDHWVAGIVATSMLFAHWLYFIAGGLKLVFANKENLSDEISNSSLRRIQHMNQFHSLEFIKEEENEMLVPSTASSAVKKEKKDELCKGWKGIDSVEASA